MKITKLTLVAKIKFETLNFEIFYLKFVCTDFDKV